MTTFKKKIRAKAVWTQRVIFAITTSLQFLFCVDEKPNTAEKHMVSKQVLLTQIISA